MEQPDRPVTGHPNRPMSVAGFESLVRGEPESHGPRRKAQTHISTGSSHVASPLSRAEPAIGASSPVLWKISLFVPRNHA
jgi:hypothetical protein